MDVVMVKTRYVYPSYTDLISLMELSGFEVCCVDQIDFSREAVYVVGTVNGEYRPHRANARNIKAFMVFWSLERPGPDLLVGYCAGMRKLLNEWNFDEIWSADPYVVGKINDSRVRYVPVGGHPDLIHVTKGKRQYDIVHLSCDAQRRSVIFNALKDQGKTIAPKAWGDTRTEILAHSGIMLNIHQNEWQILEPLRFVLAACARVPIVSEHIEHAGIYKRHGPDHYYIDVEYDTIVEKIGTLNDQDLIPMATRAYDMVTTEFGFARVVEKAVAQIAINGDLQPGVIR